MIQEKNLDYKDTPIYELVAILHGGIIDCDNSLYPSLYNRIADPKIYQWLVKTLDFSAPTLTGTVS